MRRGDEGAEVHGVAPTDADIQAEGFRFFVPGIPRPQGSKRAFKLPGGGVSMIEASKGLKDWRGDVRATALEYAPSAPLEGPIEMRAWFYFPRPKAHYVGGKPERGLRIDRPIYVTKAPDSSKLLRGIEDALEGIFFKNDAQLAIHHIRKLWALGRPGATIMIRPIKDDTQ